MRRVRGHRHEEDGAAPARTRVEPQSPHVGPGVEGNRSARRRSDVLPYAAWNAFLVLTAPLTYVYLIRRYVAGKYRRGLGERWGHLPADVRTKKAPRIWFHACSVGEVVQALQLARLIRGRLPAHEVVLSTQTPGGYDVAVRERGALLHAVFFAPFDNWRAVPRAVRAIRPDIFVCVETELWPNLLYSVRRSGARLILVNGRISDRTLRSYRRARWLFAWVLSNFDRLLVQSPRDAERLTVMGGDPRRIAVFGSSKFDATTERLDAAGAAALRVQLRLPDGGPVFVVGSTRTIEEEHLVLAAYLSACRAIPDLALVIAPRDTERAAEVEATMRSAGLRPIRRTQLAGAEGPVRQLVLDTWGELARVYALATVAFVGNSLVLPGGGQNMAEPVRYGVPVLFGPHVANFRDVAAAIEEAGVGWRVSDERALAAALIRLLTSVAVRRELEGRASVLVAAHEGAAQRYADAIAALFLSGRGAFGLPDELEDSAVATLAHA